jgi:hypothetical protein
LLFDQHKSTSNRSVISEQTFHAKLHFIYFYFRTVLFSAISIHVRRLFVSHPQSPIFHLSLIFTSFLQRNYIVTFSFLKIFCVPTLSISISSHTVASLFKAIFILSRVCTPFLTFFAVNPTIYQLEA